MLAGQVSLPQNVPQNGYRTLDGGLLPPRFSNLYTHYRIRSEYEVRLQKKIIDERDKSEYILK